MGTTSSSTATPTVGEDGESSYMSSPRIAKLPYQEMALVFDSQSADQDDLGHDTLMGLQELDSHLSIFETPADRQNGSTTPASFSDIASDASYSAGSLLPSVALDDFSNKTAIVNITVSSLQHGNVHGKLKPNSPAQRSLHRTLTDGAVRVKVEKAGTSLSSSMTTARSDISSAFSSTSSKDTSPTDFDTSREATHSSTQLPSDTKPRATYSVRPKVSIPTDIAPAEYARQCIAAAESSRLNPYSLHTEEHALLRAHLSHSQVTTYLNIRNGILRLWTRNPLIGVLRDEAIGCARDSHWFDVANVCYEWLVRKAYINYGCLETLESANPSRRPRGAKRKRRTIAVIGAGMSGLGCARQLEGLFSHFEDRFREKGEEIPRVVVLEGRDRVGGRVYSRGLKSQPDAPSKLGAGRRSTAEMGGMIVTGFDRGNPLNILVRGQLALPYHALRPTTTIYDSNGQPVDQQRDQLAENFYNDVLERVSDYKFKVPPPLNVEGDKDLIDSCRDAIGDNGKTMSQVEDAPHAWQQTGLTSVSAASITPSVLNAVGVVSITSDLTTGRSQVEPAIPAIHKAAYKARRMGWALRDGVDDERDLDLDRAVAAKGATLGSVMDAAIQQYRDIVHILPLDLRLVNWHIANLEYSNAVNYNELSLGGWDVDAGNEWEGKHTQIVGGYQQVPRGLMHCPQPLNVRKKSVVKRIAYTLREAQGVSKIECEDGSVVTADHIVCTIPLGVLKTQSIQFDPPLPEWKTGAIERLGFGILNKVVLVYKEPFWDLSRDIFGILREPVYRASLDQKDYSLRRGRFFQWFNCTKTSGVPTLLALMAGDAAFQTERDSNQSLIAEATQVLKSVFGNGVPEPVEAVVTRWGHDRFARGSYSYTGPNFKHDDYEVMAKPIGSLFFAGEHTCGTHPATVHGAYISGLRAASELLDAIIGPISVAEPLIIPKDNPATLKRKASEQAAREAKDPKQARLEAYEIEIWNAIYTKLGDRPWPPAKISANPYILYGKDNFEAARRKCEESRRPGTGRPAPNDVRIMLAKMWKVASEPEKRPYNDRAAVQKQTYASAFAEYAEKVRKWDTDALAFRKVYEAQHPSVPGPNEKELAWDSPSRRDRKAKRCSDYAEESTSEIDG